VTGRAVPKRHTHIAVWKSEATKLGQHNTDNLNAIGMSYFD